MLHECNTVVFSVILDQKQKYKKSFMVVRPVEGNIGLLFYSKTSNYNMTIISSKGLHIPFTCSLRNAIVWLSLYVWPGRSSFIEFSALTALSIPYLSSFCDATAYLFYIYMYFLKKFIYRVWLLYRFHSEAVYFKSISDEIKSCTPTIPQIMRPCPWILILQWILRWSALAHNGHYSYQNYRYLFKTITCVLLPPHSGHLVFVLFFRHMISSKYLSITI